MQFVYTTKREVTTKVFGLFILTLILIIPMGLVVGV